MILNSRLFLKFVHLVYFYIVYNNYNLLYLCILKRTLFFADLQKLEKIEHRLPSDIEPTHYDLLLYPVLDESVFHGEVTITINIHSKRNTILLHQKDLEIQDITLTTYGLEADYDIEVERTFLSNSDMFIIVLKNEIKPGFYNLSMSFDGNMANKMVGFYSSKYLNKHNVPR